SLAALVVLVAMLFSMPFFASRYVIYVATLIMINVICTQGLNVLTGYTGQLSLGNGAFVAIGAYLTAILCNQHLSFWPVLLIAPLVTGIIGVLVAVPALRLKGLYLAMVTVAFHMVVALG